MSDELNSTATQDPSTLDPEEEALFEADLKAAMEVAKKHGYYYSVLDRQQRIDYVMALAHDDEDDIALVRSEIKAAKAIDPYNYSVFARLMSLLDRLRRARRAASMHQDKTEQLKKAVETVFTNLDLPLELMKDGLKRPPAPAPGLAPA